MANFQQFNSPSYQDFVFDVAKGLKTTWKKLTWHDLRPSSWFNVLKNEGSCTKYDVIAIFVFAAVWTVMRTFITKKIFQKIATSSKLGSKETKSAPESMWKLLFSVLAWSYSAYLVLFKYELFFDPVRTILDWKVDELAPWDVYCLYMFQISYYVHAIYGTLFLDEWRKDSAVLLFHHLISITLIAVSYMFRYIYLGVLVLFLHDLNDVFLEFTKLAVYYKSRKDQWESTFDMMSSAGFVLFGVSWFIFRLYWFPLKPIYVAAYVSTVIYPDIPVPPFFFFLIGLLLVLLLLHIYWFKFILEMAFRVITGTTKEIDDVREYDQNSTTTTNKNGTHNHVHRQNHRRKTD